MSDLISQSLRLLPDTAPLTNRTAIAVHLCILESGYCPAEARVERQASGEIAMSIVPMEWLREGVQVFSGRYCRRGGNIVRELEVKMVPTSSGKVSVHACKIAAGDEKEALSGAEVDAVDMSNLNSLREEVVDMLTKLEPRTLTSVGTRRDEAGQETRDRRTNPEGENVI